MGVSLERVQFKFASIIGELCSEPDVLSQFAVWLDLRLAEYKLKGSISLDCSGEEPNPLWLKGISKGNKKAADQPISPHRPDRTSRERARGPFPHHMTSLGQTTPSSVPVGQTDENASLGQRLSPDVIIKEEPSEIYPVQMLVHQNTSTSFFASSKRKHSAAENLTSDGWSQEIHDTSSLSSSPKHKRFSSTGDSPSNQSLMSVIGGFQDNAEESMSKGDNSYDPLESTVTATNNATAMYPSNMSTDFTAEASCSFTPSSSSQDFDISIQETMQQIQPESSEISSANDCVALPDPVRWKEAMIADKCNTKRQEVERRNFIRSRIRNVDQLPTATVRNIITCVRTFERWLSEGPYNDSRPMVEIPPAELDQCLADFYRSIKTPHGTEYKPQSKLCLRSNLDRYLKYNEYPSIVSSSVFYKSQNAFREWKGQS